MLTLRPPDRGDDMGQSDEPQCDSAVRVLVRELIAELTASKPQAPDTAARRERLLDIEINGVRCTCYRVRPQAERRRTALSPREREIVRMVASGHTNQAIAD